MDHLLVDHIAGYVDPQYLDVRSKDYMGFAGETAQILIEYIRTAWYRVSTRHKMETRSAFREPWDQVFHIATYAQRPEKQQA